jgi:ferrous iron transport protein A
LKLKLVFNSVIVFTSYFGVKAPIFERAIIHMENVIAFDGLIPAGSLPDSTSLAGLPVGTNARVVAVDGRSAIARRLLEMGVVPGAPVRVIKSAPLGDPIEIRVRSYNLALRRTEAQTISVVAD